MPLPSAILVRLRRLLPAALLFLIPAPLHAQSIELTVTPKGGAASARPLPPGATPALDVTVRNDRKAATPVELSVRLEGLAFTKTDGWRQQGERLHTTIKSVARGASVARALRLRVETAPIEAATARVFVEAKGPEGKAVSAETTLTIADCAGAYRARLAALRESLAAPVRDAAEAMRRGDPALPAHRQFPYTGKRTNELRQLERIADAFAARRGADAQMATEWFRFMISRWGSELNAYASQPANPGLCANNYYQIAGYRQGLLPITQHIDTTRAAAEKSLELARKEAGLDGNVDEIARALIKEAGAEQSSNGANALAALATPRNGKPLPADLLEKLSIVETAAWLADADKRGQRLVQAIEQVLSTIAAAHRETCVCAF